MTKAYEALNDKLNAIGPDEGADEPEMDIEIGEDGGEYHVPRSRTREELDEAIGLLTDVVWFNRHLVHLEAPHVTDEIRQQADASARKVVERIGVECLGPFDDFEWGAINGKLAALRWATDNSGLDAFDMLDT